VLHITLSLHVSVIVTGIIVITIITSY